MRESKIVNALLYLILLISLLAYENHLYSYYTYTQAILFALLFLATAIILKNKAYMKEFTNNLKHNLVIIPLFIIMILSTLLSLLFFDYASFSSIFIVLLYIINTITLFLVLPIYFRNNQKFSDNFIRLYLILIIPIIIFGIILYFNNGFLGYSLEGNRSGSIYFDSNFFSIISALPCALIFRIKRKKSNKIALLLIFLLSLSGIIVSGSRGTMLSLVICLIYYIFIKYSNKNIIKKGLLVSIVIIAAIMFFKNIENIPFLRLDQGSHGRSEMIIYALNYLQGSPIFGYGFDSISSVLREAGFANSNTHNSLVDFAFRYGYIALIIYLIILLRAFFKSNSNKNKLHINLLLILLYVNMNTILYSFGGVGLPSMALTLCMGLACYEEGGKKGEKIKYYNTSLQR
ncbi:TPA: O-antigen ligase family protein [Candidatus Ventrenecus avicola]|nr:O-antigen ligase family protein [Candidatus Ventrenecus avicola]